MIKPSDFVRFGIDTSRYNFETKLPDYKMAVAQGAKFVVIRTSVGQVVDKRFKVSWADAKGKLLRFTYPFLDYYSHYMENLGFDDVQWGQRQAQFTHSLVKDDNDGTIDFLDIEKCSFAPKIEDDIYRVRRIASAYLTEKDKLNGKLNGLYLSLSLIKFFLMFKNRPLFLALYNRNYTKEQVIAMARAQGWTGQILIWQFASDGDIDGDGTGAGRLFGTEYNTLDLDGWVGTVAEYNLSGQVTVIKPPVTPSTPPTQTPKTKQIEIGITLRPLQYVRKLPDINAPWVDKLLANQEVELLEYKKDLKGNQWARIGFNQWAAVEYGGTLFIQRALQ
jgi:GH25 family lysozyme M1 (1,4-beta-N-acetylmuramidase)